MKTRQYSSFFRAIAIIILVVFVIAGFVLGDIFEVAGSYSFSRSFNWGLMFSCWVVGILMALTNFAVYAHLKNQELIIEKLDKTDM